MNILIYYNPNHKSFIIKYVDFLPLDKETGFENSYNHILIQILAVDGDHFVNVNGWHDWALKTSCNREKLKSRIVRKLMAWLNKYRD